MADDFMASPPKKKKLPFKPTALRRAGMSKPKLAANAKDSDDDGLDLFRRSKEMAPIVAADRERRMRRHQNKRALELEKQAEKRAEKQAEKQAERRTSAGDKRPHDDGDVPIPSGEPRSDSTEPLSVASPPAAAEASNESVDDQPTTRREEDRTSELVTPPPSKRSRISTDSAQSFRASVDENEEVVQTSPSTRRLRNHRPLDSEIRQPLAKSFASSSALVISLDSDSEEDDVKLPPATLNRRRSSSIEIMGGTSPRQSSPQADEDEFAEYVRRAEEQRARDQELLRTNEDGSQAKESTEIYVSSVIEGAQPVVVKFLFDKPLRVVRDTWIAIQQRKGVRIPTDEPDDVVLTWRRKKVYNYSTLLSLGIRPQGDGLLAADTHGRAGFSESRTRVHFEAWTPDLFREMEHDEDLRRRRENGELSDEEEKASEEPPAPEVKIKIILKARELEPVKLTVRPETTVETLITGFRTQRNVGANQDVSLWFDGEKLEEHVTMDDAEIDDMDTIEVHIK